MLALFYSWSAANIAGNTKKSAVIITAPLLKLLPIKSRYPLSGIVNALFLFSFALANILGTQIFQAKDAPQYLPGT
jgi:MFS transporter, ACS family, allantoate permease